MKLVTPQVQGAEQSIWLECFPAYRQAGKTLSSAGSRMMGDHHCGLTQPCKSCFISVESIKRWHYKVFPASPPDLQNLLRLRRYEKIVLRQGGRAGVSKKLYTCLPVGREIFLSDLLFN